MPAPSTAVTFDPRRPAREGILAPAGLDVGRVEQALGLVLGSAVDSADLYFQLSREESWALEDGIVKEGNHSIEQGVGVRAMSGEKTGFAYSDEIILPELLTAAQSARAIAQSGREGGGHALSPRDTAVLYAPIDPVDSLPNEDKIILL